MSILRRLPLSRLLLLCGVVVAFGIGMTALALALGGGPTPPPQPLAKAVHDALSAPRVNGVSARIQFTNRLLEGASLASSGGEANQLASSPLLAGASGRLWIGSEGHARLELQSENGDTQILYDGHTLSLYDAATNTLYRYTPKQTTSTQPANTTTGTQPTNTQPAGMPPTGTQPADRDQSEGHVPSVAEIEEHIGKADQHANISGAIPTDVAGQAAYTVRVTPRENGGLIGAAELSWDAVHGVPLRAAIYSTTSPSPALELAATEISYEAVDSSTLDFTPPANAKVEEIGQNSHAAGAPGAATGSPTNDGGKHPHLSTHGRGLETIALLESPVKSGSSATDELEGLQKVNINGTSASELPTALGTLLSFERAGVRYLLVGSVTPASIEAFARSL